MKRLRRASPLSCLLLLGCIQSLDLGSDRTDASDGPRPSVDACDTGDIACVAECAALQSSLKHCGKCGYFEVAIPRPDALHRTIAAAVIRKPTLISGPEMAFLRSELGMTGKALAKTLGVVQESVSRWEHDALPLSPTIDHLLRTMVALTLNGEKFPVESLATIEGQSGPMKLVVRVDDKGAWSRAA